ncbi:MAG: GWxTD domain-containing protein [Gemmatimonadaceae bacterium]|nr:GWxTD domain-containing protein [Gemmatimonadaceae bacterium]
MLNPWRFRAAFTRLVVAGWLATRIVWPQPAFAQRATAPIATRADSVAASGDTARAYAMLDSALRANKADGAAWHQFGLLNWNMARSRRNANYVSDQRAVRLLRGADSALRLATQFSPDSARYWLSLGRFNLGSGIATMRFAASGQVSNALDAARKTGDTLLLATSADEVGMAIWRRYEPVANRALLSDGQQKIQLTMFNSFSRDKARDFIDSYIHKIDPPTGQKDYLQATEHFRMAVDADPTSQRYSRHLYMAFGERGRWSEMLAVAGQRARAFPLDDQAQLARGLALHRLGDDQSAQVAFDSAFALMDDVDQARLTRLTRILRPKATKATKGTVGDTTAFGKLPAAQQRGLEQMFWFMSDPLTLTNENEYRLEFLSRVVWSDFRWTNEDAGLRGADTDRGDIFVRYGPPELEMTVPGTSSFQASNTDGGVTLVWAYASGLVFFFDLPPGFGTARFAFVDRDNVEQIMSAMPVSWANIASTRQIDTIPVRVTRFRATADSADAVVASLIPIDSLVRGLELTSAPIDVDFRIFDQFVRVKGVESVQQAVRPDSANAPMPRNWLRRLGPGINVVRVEALQADSKRAARAMARINPDATNGFGMSDILLGDKPVLRDGVAPRRWRDVVIEPGIGSYGRGTSVGLLWEMYDLVAREGASKYRVSLAVERADRTAAGRLAARVVDGLGRTIGRPQVSRDKLTIAFDRSAAAAGTLVEFLSLDVSDSPPGTYRLRVEITDLGNGRRTSRLTEFRIK